jgi:argininosuccinate lyase
MRAALASTMMATDLADYLVERGVSFRDAHASVGRLVRESEESGVELHSLPRASFAAAHAAFGDDVFDALSPVQSVERREVDGGTGPRAVREQIEAAAASLATAGEVARGNELFLRAVG